MKTSPQLRIAKSRAHKRIKLVVTKRDILEAEDTTDWTRTHEQTCPISQSMMRQFGLSVGAVNTCEDHVSSTLGVYPLPPRALTFSKAYDSREKRSQRLRMQPISFIAHQSP